MDVYLGLTGEVKFVRIDTVSDGASDDWHPMKYYRWFIGILEEDLFENGPEDRDGDEGCGKGEDGQAFG